ncbi:FtsX-like permease family protein [Glaciibacter superstes]|uniref:FtsX-like permease family protein n=1 Tax=Glaciibacter superstes TaxID=501023 RepID=UPI0003B4B47F|nr:FtsX-like permease family protein [Glaciibacter superstes]
MIRLALLSIARHRAGAAATALVTLVGVVLLSGMAGVMATGLAASTPGDDRAFLVQFPAILGSWILGIVAFAVISTVGVALGGRTDEIRGLRLIGATPGQVRRMVAIETLVIATTAAVPGVLLGYALGAVIVTTTATTGVISGAGGFVPGVLAPVLAGLIVIAAATIGAFVGSREAANRSPIGEPTAKRRSQAARPRRILAGALILIGLASSATALVMEPDSVYATAATGPGCVLVAVGAALLATEMLTLAERTLLVALHRLGGVGARLAATNIRIAPERIRPAVTFLTLFVGVAAGTLSMQSIENQAAGSGDGIGQLMAAINYLVVLLIAAFMSIALINNLIASIKQRRGELAVMSSIGATTGQSTRMLVCETAMATIVAVVVGLVGSIAAVIPFAILKTGTVADAVQGLPLIAVVIAASGIALLTTVITGKQTARTARAV